jgi:similar to stage IV sporulation protein
LVFSQLFLFDVRVEGNEQIGEDELHALLDEVGLSRGAFLPGIEEGEVAIALRQRDGRIAYAAVNLRGNVARVQIRERVTPPQRVTAPANLVAKCDGVVTMPIVFAGEVLVREGEIVRAGQLLVSGILDSEKHGYRVTRAAGEVLARTTHTYTVRVPFSYLERCKRATTAMSFRCFSLAKR